MHLPRGLADWLAEETYRSAPRNARLADATIAARQCSFLISGERDTGKRRFAEELHRDGPFVVVPRNQPEVLTPALIDEAIGGTLYLEEGADFDAVTLAYVLGLADVRVIVATRGERPIAVAIEICEKTLTFADARREVVAELERRYVTRALEKAGHNVAKAAANSGIAHRYFQVLKSRRKTG